MPGTKNRRKYGCKQNFITRSCAKRPKMEFRGVEVSRFIYVCIHIYIYIFFSPFFLLPLAKYTSFDFRCNYNVIIAAITRLRVTVTINFRPIRIYSRYVKLPVNCSGARVNNFLNQQPDKLCLSLTNVTLVNFIFQRVNSIFYSSSVKVNAPEMEITLCLRKSLFIFYYWKYTGIYSDTDTENSFGHRRYRFKLIFEIISYQGKNIKETRSTNFHISKMSLELKPILKN